VLNEPDSSDPGVFGAESRFHDPLQKWYRNADPDESVTATRWDSDRNGAFWGSAGARDGVSDGPQPRLERSRACPDVPFAWEAPEGPRADRRSQLRRP